MSAKGGDFGGGTTIRNVELSEKAAQELRRRATIASTRYRKEEANAAASDILEHLAAGRVILMTEDMRAALPWLQEARAQCFNEAAQRGLDQLIAAILAAPRPPTMQDSPEAQEQLEQARERMQQRQKQRLS